MLNRIFALCTGNKSAAMQATTTRTVVWSGTPTQVAFSLCGGMRSLQKQRDL
jgi:hypothetical protein